jgi:hypothetical protein
MMMPDPDTVASISLGASVFAQTKLTFSAHDFAQFLNMGGMPMDDETADEFLSDMVDAGKLRQIGPGVYAAKASG